MTGFFITEDTLSPMLVVGATELMEGAEEIALYYAQEILTYAKDNAPWEDRTGDARAGLDIDVDRTDLDIIIELFHTVDYGLWLEVIQSGRFATIMPTLERYSHELFLHLHATQTGEDLNYD